MGMKKNALYNLFTNNIENLSEKDLTIISRLFEKYGDLLNDVLKVTPQHTDSDIQKSLEKLVIFQIKWYDAILQIRELKQKEELAQRDDIEAIVKVTKQPPLQLRKKISNRFLNRWRQKCIQRICDQYVTLLESLPNFKPYIQKINQQNPQKFPDFNEMKTITEFLFTQFQDLNNYLIEEYHRVFVPSNKERRFVIIRNQTRER